MGRFDDKVAWITGAGSGLGRALALELAREGADVALTARRAARLEEVAEEVRRLGRRAAVVPCDVTDDDAVRRAAADAVAALGRLDIAVANAGMGVTGLFEKLSDADWRRQFDVNVFGAVSTARHALPELRRTGGRLVLVASVAGLICTPGSSAYSASKFALRAVGLTLSEELHGSGVTCTTIHPGFVATEITQVDNEGRFDPARRDPRPAKLIWPPDRAARVMVRAIHRRKREYIFTGHGKVGGWVGKHTPGLAHFLLTRVGGKTARKVTTER